MRTSYNAQICKGENDYNIQFHTDDYEVFKLVEHFIQDCKDGNKEQWVHLPCKVGDTVYVLWQTANDDYKVLKDEIWRFTVGEIGLIIESEYIEDGIFGQDVFLTRKEAEKSLTERNKQ